jgi:hypothetical protein
MGTLTHILQGRCQLEGQVCLGAAERHEAVVKLLLITGKVDADSKDKDGRSPLSWAPENGHEAVVKLLLNRGKVDVNSKDKDGRSPLSWTAASGHDAVAKLPPLKSTSVIQQVWDENTSLLACLWWRRILST